MGKRIEFLDELDLIKTVIYAKKCDPTSDEYFRIFYINLLEHLSDLARTNSPASRDQPERNYEYIFFEITYNFRDDMDLFVNSKNQDDSETAPYRNKISDKQASLLVKLGSLLDSYELENLPIIQKQIGEEPFEKINNHYKSKNKKSIFPYTGINKIISLDPEWSKIRTFAKIVWDEFVFFRLKE